MKEEVVELSLFILVQSRSSFLFLLEQLRAAQSGGDVHLGKLFPPPPCVHFNYMVGGLGLAVEAQPLPTST